jgi:non-specific serine/threonine protein kinase
VRRLFTGCYSVGQTEACLGQQIGILGQCTFLATAHHQHLEVRVEATAISREEGFASQLAWSLVYAAQCLATAGRFESIEPLLLESVTAGRQSGAITSMLASTGGLARLYMLRSDLSRARRTVDEAIALAGQVGIQLPTVSLLITRGDIATAELDWQSASHWYRQALRIATLAGARGIVAVALRHYAALCVAHGEPARAVRIFAATASIRKAPLLIHIPMIDEDIVATARRALGDDAFEIAWAEGQSMTLQQVMTQVMGAPLSLRQRAGVSAGASTSHGLTPREREVAVMLAAGRSNRDIAERLVITEGTVEVHVKRILGKLGFHSRSQVAAWMAEQNLNGVT